MTKDAFDKAMQELKRLEMMPPMSAESTVSRNYLDWLLAVPWKQKITRDQGHSPSRADPGIEIITALRKSRNAFSNSWLCASWSRPRKARSCALLALREWARRLWDVPLLAPPGASSCGYRWVGSAMRQKSAATGAPISALFPVRLFK